jgi:hypothetical protein
MSEKLDVYSRVMEGHHARLACQCNRASQRGAPWTGSKAYKKSFLG